MKAAGIDLATTAAKTAVCVVDWSEAEICVGFRDDALDDCLIRVCRDDDIEKVGIDCPFGWPAPFVAAISAHALGQAWQDRDHPVPAGFGNMLAYRLTDFRVKARVPGAKPLAVAADKLGKTAMRCAFLDALGSVDRSGRSGRIAEVYPAASLLKWQDHGLKPAGPAEVLGQLETLVPTVTFQPGRTPGS